MTSQIMVVSPEIFSEMHYKYAELYDWLCVDHEIKYRAWLREKFGIESGSFDVKVDYSLIGNDWNFPQCHKII